VTDVTDELTLAPAERLRVIWSRGAVAAYASPGEVEPAWRLEGELAPAFSALRVISAATGDGSLLVLASARPAKAAGHDEEAVAAALGEPGEAPEPLSEALLSTEYAADGSIRRLGLELYKQGDDYPVRAAGDAIDTRSSNDDSVRRESARLRFRMDGSEGVALYEIIELP
jgi:hypothetical protein